MSELVSRSIFEATLGASGLGEIKEIREEDGQKAAGYAGKILRINLTELTTEIIPTSRYCPRTIGGWDTANAIFYDEVKTAVKAFDPENKIIYMLGPGAGTGVPVMNRASVTGVSPNSLPEQYTHSNMGGYFGPELKWAGYDGLVIEGKAPGHTYVVIEDDQVTFHDADADGLWGAYVIETQEKIFQRYGRDYFSLVIGPAGENLVRISSITNGNNSCSAMAGFGAVWGSKNLKAIAVHGTGTARPGISYEELMELRLTLADPKMKPNPLVRNRNFDTWGNDYFEAPEDMVWYKAFTSCSHGGCNSTCMRTHFEVLDPLTGGRVTQVTKCMENFAANMKYDCAYRPAVVMYSKKQQVPGAYNRCNVPDPLTDPTDPFVPFLTKVYGGDRLDLWEPNMELGQTVTWLCVQYGLDKWDTVIWYMTWLAMCKKEGLLEGLDFGREVDPGDPEFMKYFLHMVVYREGPLVSLADGSRRPIGDLLAEGMALAIRALGKEKYGDSIYHGRYNAETGERLDIPVSFETGWGHCSHWLGRGFQNCPKTVWMAYMLNEMMDSRPAKHNGHLHMWVEDYAEMSRDPAHSQLLCEYALSAHLYSVLKDSLVSCEWKTPNPGRPDQEAALFRAATGIPVTQQQLLDECMASRLRYRAILMRNYGRDRDMETAEVYPWMTYPDPWGDTATWDEWNDLVDLYYRRQGFDLATGWPYRSTWEKYGLKEIADEMEALGKLPPEGRTEYTRKPDPLKKAGKR